MKAILRLECIGDDTYQKLRKFSCIERAAGAQASVAPPQWVAEIKGTGGKYGIEREFMMAKKDYSQANSVGSRGIYAEYYLETGRYYEVKQTITWSRFERYFCKVTEDGDIVKVDREEILKLPLYRSLESRQSEAQHIESRFCKMVKQYFAAQKVKVVRSPRSAALRLPDNLRIANEAIKRYKVRQEQCQAKGR